MKIEISYSPKVEARILLNALLNWELGVLHKLNMNILPYDASVKRHPYGVVIPMIAYDQLPDLLADLKRSSFDKSGTSFLSYTPHNLENVIDLLIKRYGTKVAWQIDEKKLVDLLHDIAADIKVIFGIDAISNLTIHQSRFGPGTMSSPLKKLGGNVDIAVREGASITNVIAALFDSITHLHTTDLKLEQYELRPIRDWLIYNTRLGLTLKKHKLSFVPSTTYMRKKSPNKQNSLNLPYVKSLNIFTAVNSFEVLKGEVLFNNKVLSSLTANEKRLLTCLITLKNKIVTYDNLLDVLEEKNREVSYYAVYKALERLRKKLILCGLPSNIIKTIPCKGVMLIAG